MSQRKLEFEKFGLNRVADAARTAWTKDVPDLKNRASEVKAELKLAFDEMQKRLTEESESLILRMKETQRKTDRMVWREGVDLRKWYDEDEERRPYNLFYADVMAWVERTKVVLGNVFYNKKFVDDYESALQRNAYDDQDAYLDPANCLSVTAEYIRTIGQLARRGFIKDPYSGIDNGDSPLCFIAMWFDKGGASLPTATSCLPATFGCEIADGFLNRRSPRPLGLG